jgi:hypothetical protein
VVVENIVLYGRSEDMIRAEGTHDAGMAKTRCGQREDMMRAGRIHDAGRGKT